MKISPDLEKVLLGKAAEGWSARKLAEWLAAERGIRITPQAINARLRQTRVERSEVAKAVTREKLVPHVVNDLDVLAKEQQRVERLSGRLHARANAALDALESVADGKATEGDREALKIAVLTSESMSELALKASDRVKAISDRKLHYAGADGDDESGAEEHEAGERIRSRLDRLAAEAGDGGGAPEAGADEGG